MSNREEPSYLMAARNAISYNESSSALVVRELVARIDRDAGALKAASRMSRTVTTVRDLDDLPIGSVVLADGGKSWQKESGVLPWQYHGFAFGTTSEWIFAHRPVTVLYEPQP